MCPQIQYYCAELGSTWLLPLVGSNFYYLIVNEGARARHNTLLKLSVTGTVGPPMISHHLLCLSLLFGGMENRTGSQGKER